MSLFLRHYGGELSVVDRAGVAAPSRATEQRSDISVENALETLCDEEAIDNI